MLAEPYLYSLGTYSGQPASMCSVCVRVFFRLQGRGVNHSWEQPSTGTLQKLLYSLAGINLSDDLHGLSELNRTQPTACKITYLIIHPIPYWLFSLPVSLSPPLSVFPGITFQKTTSTHIFVSGSASWVIQIRQPLSFWTKAMDTLRKCKHKNFCKYVQKFIDNLKGIQTSQFKEPFLLQVQDSWDLNYMIKTTVERFHGNRSVMLKNFPTPLLFIVKEEASSSHYFVLMCIKSNLIENKTTVGLNFYTLKKNKCF